MVRLVDAGMATSPTLWLITNPSSGSNEGNAVKELTDGLGEAGLTLKRVIAVPDEELPSSEELTREAVDILAVFTGDGTANSAIGAAEGWRGTLLVLPGGTTNLLAKSLHGDDVTPERVVDAIRAGRSRKVERNLIVTSRGFAHSEVLAGPGAAWSDVRESMREVDIAGLAGAMSEAVQKSAAGPQTRAAEPKLGKPEGYPAILATVDSDRMIVDAYGAEGLADYFRQGVALLKRDFREGPHENLGRHQRLVLESDAPIELMIDGERSCGQQREELTLRPARVAFLSTRS